MHVKGECVTRYEVMRDARCESEVVSVSVPTQKIPHSAIIKKEVLLDR